MKYIIDKDWLFKNLQNPQLRIADCRFSLKDSGQGAREYSMNHLPDAIYFDLEKDLSAPPGVHGGRHPLPDWDQFIKKLEQAGIGKDTILIAYDNGDGAFAARFWWMLRYLGHEKVYVLDGGFQGWLKAGSPLSQTIPHFEKATFIPDFQNDIKAEYEEVKKLVNEENKCSKILIDSREKNRYLGFEEPIDKKAGRIPGALNKPWFEGYENGNVKPAEKQRERFSDLDPKKEIIVYCGSGVTAAPNYLLLKEAGFEKVKLYPGSFSDWISYEDNPVAAGEE